MGGAAKPGGGRPKKAAGLCVLCRVTVRDALRHYTSDAHQAKVRAEGKRRARKG
jgi:hypothetical protein